MQIVLDRVTIVVFDNRAGQIDLYLHEKLIRSLTRRFIAIDKYPSEERSRHSKLPEEGAITRLQAASYHDHTGIVNFLLDHGLDVKTQ